MSGTVAGALQGTNELPQFPGIPVAKLVKILRVEGQVETEKSVFVKLIV